MHLLSVFLIINYLISGIVISQAYVAEDEKYRFQVSIRDAGFPICSGSIINHYFVLTAAQCIYKKYTSDITVIAGTNNIFNDTITYAADKLIWYDYYNEVRGWNDIGLIRVDKYMEYNSKVQPIKFYPAENIPSDLSAIVTGWGRLTLDPSIELQEIEVVEMRECQSPDWLTMKNNLCASHTSNCSLNAGDPLTIEGEQIGVVSYGSPHTINDPDIYTKIFPYIQWIEDNSKINSGIQVYPSIGSTIVFAMSTIMLYLHSLTKEY